MRRSPCIRPALGLMLTCLLLLPCAGCGEKTDPFQSYFSEKPFVEFLTEEDTATLRAQYPQEFELLDEMFGPVTLFREDALELVTDQAIEDSESGFTQIAGAAYALAFERAAQDFNAEQATKAEQAQGGLLELLRANPDQLEVRNRTSETLVPYKPLKGKEGALIAVGAHVSKSVSIGCSTGETLFGYEVGQSTASLSVSYTLDGPSSSDRVGSYYATHRWAFGLLLGSLEHIEYDLYNVSTGEFHSHYSMNTIVAPKRTVGSLLCTITGSGGTFVRHAINDNVSNFEKTHEASNAICVTPSIYF